MVCKDSIFAERGRGWSGIIADGSKPSWARDERHFRMLRAWSTERRSEARIRRMSERRGPASKSESPQVRPCGRESAAMGWQCDADRLLFEAIEAGTWTGLPARIEPQLWRNRAVLRKLAASGKQWARKLAIYIPSSRPK